MTPSGHDPKRVRCERQRFEQKDELAHVGGLPRMEGTDLVACELIHGQFSRVLDASRRPWSTLPALYRVSRVHTVERRKPAKLSEMVTRYLEAVALTPSIVISPSP